MSESMKAGAMKPAPPLPKGALVGKSPKDFPAPKKLLGPGLAKAVLKQDELPQLKPPLAPKGQMLKPGVSELKPLASKKPAPSIGPDAVKKVGIDAPKMCPPGKDDLLVKKMHPEMVVKKLDPPKSVSAFEKAKAVEFTSSPLKSEVKPVPTVKFQTPVSSSPLPSEIQAEQKLGSQGKIVSSSAASSSESKAKLIPYKEEGGEGGGESRHSGSASGKLSVPGPAQSRVQGAQESQCYSKGSVGSANKGLGSDQSGFQSGMLPQIGGGVPNIFDKSGSPNYQGLDPAIWQMVTTIAAICSTACQNGSRSRSRHCCRKRHSRKHKKEAEPKDVDSNSSNKDSSDPNETQEEQAPKESGDDKAKRMGERRSSQNDNTVSGTKWHGIEKKIATIRGLRDLEDSDSNVDDEELAATDALVQGIGKPRYSDAVEFPSEMSTINNSSRARRYLAKQGVCTGPKFSKSPFVGGLSAARRRPYSSLTEMAAYFSNIEPQDQNDVIVMLLACRKLEKQIEEQQVVMQLLEHDLKEAQSLLRFPPEWRSLSNSEVLGHPPLPTGQIPSTNDPPYVSNHPNSEPPWVNKRPKDGLPSRAPTKQ